MALAEACGLWIVDVLRCSYVYLYPYGMVWYVCIKVKYEKVHMMCIYVHVCVFIHALCVFIAFMCMYMYLNIFKFMLIYVNIIVFSCI